MKRWYHEVSAGWLKARQSVLTATDVSSLLPEYKRYLKQSDPDKLMPGFAALWASKNTIADLDTSSPSSAAARGHIMEPWAVRSWNTQTQPYMYHWDDCLIRDSTGKLGFSPDAMTVMQKADHPVLDVYGDETMGVENILYHQPAEILEIKSYEPAKHMKAVITERMMHDELMQLAMAFVVLPYLEKAHMLWFCPGAPISMHTEEYTRDDLHDQIRWIMEIAEVYYKQAQLCEKLSSNMVAQCTEEEVWQEFLKEQEMNSDNVFILKG